MKTSGTKSVKPSKMLPKWLLWTFIGFSFIGFIDASFLTISHYTGHELGCSVITGCNDVLNSKYAIIPFINIPMAMLGMGFYLLMLFLSLLYFDTRNIKILSLIPVFAFIGFLFTLWLIYLQGVVIKSWCQYCLISATTSTALFILSFFILKFKKK